jgi:hypothetical protein
MKKLVIALSALGLFAGSAATAAVPHRCRDSKGHFVKCPQHHAAAATVAHKCRNAKGHFIKCGAKAKPA